MNVTDAKSFTAVSADTTAFELKGGKYGVVATATWSGGSATLKTLAADGTTFVTVLTAFSADGYASVDLPPGQYKFVVATATAGALSITRIPS